jgi:AcrR family transcriptional regulator
MITTRDLRERRPTDCDTDGGPVPKPYSTEALCRSMLDRGSPSMTVRNPEIAIKKLTVIIDAALTISNKKGFQAMSLRDLSREAGVSMGGLYAYFDSKTSLLNMILGEVTAAVEDVLSHPPAEVLNDPVEHMKWLIDSHICLTEKMLPWFAFSFMEAKNFPRKERQMAIDSEVLTESYFADVAQRAQEQGVFRPDVTPILPMLIKPLLQDWYVKRSKYRRRGVDVASYSATVQKFVLDACLQEKR